MGSPETELHKGNSMNVLRRSQTSQYLSYNETRNTVDKNVEIYMRGPFVFGTIAKNRMVDTDMYHRKNLPASISRGAQSWYNGGDRHNAWGPAVIYANGVLEYWLCGGFYQREDWEIERLKYLGESI